MLIVITQYSKKLFKKLCIYFLIGNAVEIKNISASWIDGYNTSTLNDIVLNVKVGELCAIIGPVGAGKVFKYKYISIMIF